MDLRKPKLIVIGGFAGAGKSSLAVRLGQTFAIPVFEIDQIAQAIKSSSEYKEVPGSSDHYCIAFDLFFSMAKTFLNNGCSIILDQNMGRERTWQNLKKLTDQIDIVDLKIFILDCPFEVCVQRVSGRKEHPNLLTVTAEVLHEHKYKWDFINENKLEDAIRIDATKSKDDVFKEVRSMIDGSKSYKEAI